MQDVPTSPARKRGSDCSPGRQDRADQLWRLQRDLTISLTSPGTLHEMLARVLAAGCQVEGIDCGGIYLVDPSGPNLDLVCHRGLSRKFVSTESHFPRHAPQIQLVMQGKALYLNRAQIAAASRKSMAREGMRSLSIVPVSHASRVVAVMNLASRRYDEIVPHARSAIEAIAAQIGPTIARLRAESAVQASERNLQSLFNSVEDFLFVVDGSGRLVHVNPVVVRRLGYSVEELKGKPATLVHPPSQRRRAGVIIKAMVAGMECRCDIPLQTLGGLLIPVETRVVHGEWGGAPALFGISRDVTDRQRAERELMERQRQLHALVSQLGVAEETERRRIAYGVHDDMGQLLALCKMNLGGLAARMQASEDRDAVAEITTHVDRLIGVSRALTFDLASPVLQRFGLQAALEDLCEKMTTRHGVAFALRGRRRDVALPNASEIIVYHAVRELLRNIVRHARATRADVRVKCAKGNLIVTVEDDGIGMRSARQGRKDPESFGLHAIRERIHYLGGTFAMEDAAPHGVRVTLVVPLPRSRAG